MSSQGIQYRELADRATAYLIQKYTPVGDRIGLGLGAVPAAVLLLLRLQLPETAIWLLQKGRFRQAKEVSRALYGELPGLRRGRRRWSSRRSRSTCRFCSSSWASRAFSPRIS